MVCPGNANIGEKAVRASLAPPKCEEQKSKASCTGRAGKCDLRTRSEGLTASKAPGAAQRETQRGADATGRGGWEGRAGSPPRTQAPVSLCQPVPSGLERRSTQEIFLTWRTQGAFGGNSRLRHPVREAGDGFPRTSLDLSGETSTRLAQVRAAEGGDESQRQRPRVRT